MRDTFTILISLFILQIISGVRIPPNPCSGIFSYYKDPRGRIYGEAVVPYDNATNMEFSVNASLVGRYRKSELRLVMVTTLNELNDYTPRVIYNVFFPFEDIIPKITAISYNGRTLCSGPGEPVIPGTPGITNVWHKIFFRFNRRHTGFYQPDRNPDGSDSDLPVKQPGELPQIPQRPQIPQQRPQQRPQQIPPRRPPIETPDESVNDFDLPTKLPETPPKSSQPEGPSTSNIDDDLIDSLFTSPTPDTPMPATFTSPSVAANDEFKCGMSSNQPPRNEIVPLIFDGQNTDVGEYPWLVAFFTKSAQGQGYDYKCSGNLISDKHVITAARCVQYYKIQIVKTEDIMLVMGTNNLRDWQTSGAVSRKVRKVLTHPSFQENSKSAHGDIAILTMERSVQFSKILIPVCLWKGNTDLFPFYNKTGAIAGYGQDEDAERNGQSHVLRAKRANMPIVSQAECLTSPIGFKDVTSDRTFCTKSGETPSGPCIGDSGAGFYIKLDGVAYLRGIASAISTKNGICDLSNQYSVFCDVAKFLDWIKTAME